MFGLSWCKDADPLAVALVKQQFINAKIVPVRPYVKVREYLTTGNCGPCFPLVGRDSKF